MLTRFDESSINSFNIPTLQYLLECGFEIQYENSIHLKLYIADNDVYISSSNFTQVGFEDNIELTVNIDSNNVAECKTYFDELWEKSSANKITKELLDANFDKYEILKKREKFRNYEQSEININLQLGDINIQSIVDWISNEKKDYTDFLSFSYEANIKREKTKIKLLKGFDIEIFYVPENYAKRRDNLFYEFVYGDEAKMAGTGLREKQFKSVFEHPDFKEVIIYIFPEMVGLEPWNLEDIHVYNVFCTGLFDFDIPQYSEALPIRLASYFYPDYFVSIFKLEDLQKVCESFGLVNDSKKNGERLFVYYTS